MAEHFVGENKIFVIENQPKEIKYPNPLVLVHGSWGASWMWRMYNEFFTKEGFKTYALDLRGHGRSGGKLSGATMEDYVSDVDVAVKELGIQNPIIIGHSMGGLVAMLYCAGREVEAMISINGSPTAEAQGEGEEVEYPPEYTPMEAGMPTDPMEAMKVFPDIPQEMLMKMKEMLGKESGVARSQRKKGLSVSRENINAPMLFIGTENADSVPFGVGIEKSKKMAEFYNGDFMEIQGATHPGILMGEHSMKGAKVIEEWIKEL